jgi:hypothetical protein
MTATALTAVAVTRDAPLDMTAALDAVDSANDNSFSNTGTTLLRVQNTNAADRILTVCFANQTPDGVVITPVGKQFTITATTGDVLLGPFPVTIYGSTVTLKWSAGTGVTAKVIQPAN